VGYTDKEHNNKGAGFPPRHKCPGFHPVDMMKVDQDLSQSFKELALLIRLEKHHKEIDKLLSGILKGLKKREKQHD